VLLGTRGAGDDPAQAHGEAAAVVLRYGLQRYRRSLRGRLVALHGTAARGAVTAGYRSCEACKQVTRRTRTAKGPPLQVRPFTVERLAVIEGRK